MRISLDDKSIKKLQTKRLLRYGTVEPQELYQTIEQLKDEMLFQPLSTEMFVRWFESLKSKKLNKAVERHSIEDFSIEWSRRVDSDTIELKVAVKEHATAQTRQISVAFST